MDAAHIDIGDGGFELSEIPVVVQTDGNQVPGAVDFHVHQGQGYTQVLHYHVHQLAKILLAEQGKTEQAVSLQIQFLSKAKAGGHIIQQFFALTQ